MRPSTLQQRMVAAGSPGTEDRPRILRLSPIAKRSVSIPPSRNPLARAMPTSASPSSASAAAPTSLPNASRAGTLNVQRIENDDLLDELSARLNDCRRRRRRRRRPRRRHRGARYARSASKPSSSPTRTRPTCGVCTAVAPSRAAGGIRRARSFRDAEHRRDRRFRRASRTTRSNSHKSSSANSARGRSWSRIAAGSFSAGPIGSIVNEAVVAVSEEVASPEDVDTAMRLGANYPIGPIEWGREIGGARIRRILKRLADERRRGVRAASRALDARRCRRAGCR